MVPRVSRDLAARQVHTGAQQVLFRRSTKLIAPGAQGAISFEAAKEYLLRSRVDLPSSQIPRNARHHASKANTIVETLNATAKENKVVARTSREL